MLLEKEIITFEILPDDQNEMKKHKPRRDTQFLYYKYNYLMTKADICLYFNDYIYLYIYCM